LEGQTKQDWISRKFT